MGRVYIQSENRRKEYKESREVPLGTVMLGDFFSKDREPLGERLMLVNASHPIPQPMNRPSLIPVCDEYPEILMEETAAQALKRLLRDIGSGGRIVPVSGWRSHEEQQKIWDDTAAERGIDFTRKYVAVPGCSEHETGLAIDLAENAPDIDFICPEFSETGICGLFRRMAPYYGFVLRYPKDKQDVTGIGNEPWHFRYVGMPHALIMQREGLVLEEYVDWLEKGGRQKGA